MTDDSMNLIFEMTCVYLDIIIGLIHVETHTHVHWLVLVVVAVSAVY